ncbi:MAG TPA: fibronectin type III domain-containing protein [Oscillospiraceae bacterium]|nr:fibronectin type III domain-containing protein [Oscillospiraceae bacterium]
MKKVISLFLSAMMILTSVLCVNFSAFAKDIESGSIKLGKNTVKASEFDYKDDEVDKTKINFSFTLAQKHTLTQGYDSSIYTDDNGDEYDHYYLDNVISSEGNTITETKEDGTKVTYTCKNTKANEDDEDDFSFVDGDGNLFPYQIDCDSAQCRNHLKTGDNVQCYFTVRSDDYNIDVPFTIDIKEFDISGITFTLAEKHTLTQGYDSYIRTDDNSDEYDHYNFWNVIYSEGNTLTVTKKGGTPVTYTCKNAKANEDDEDNFSFVDSDGNHFDYELDFYTSQSKNHLKPGKNVQCSFRVYNIDVPFTVDIDENPIASIEYIGNITVSDKDKHTDDDGDYYYDYTIYQPGAKIVIHYKNNTSDTYICKGFYNEDEMDYGFINVNDSEDWLDVDYRADTPIWTAGGNNLIYIMCHSVITTIPVTVIPSTPVPNPTPNPTPAPSPAPAQPVPAPSTSTSAPAAQTIAQPAAPKNNKKVKVASAKAGKKSVKVTWKKVKGIKGYQIQYSTNKKFKKGNKTITVKSKKSTSATIKKLKSKKKYYVRMRTYKIVNGKKVYSAWSKAKSVKVK